MSVIKKQMLKGVKWTGISTLLITILQILQFALLAKQMSLAQFGLVGMITTIVIFAQILLDLGLGSAIIQKEELRERMLSTLYWLNLLVGLGLFALLMGASPLIAAFFHREELTGLIRLLAVMFLIAPVGQQSQYLLQRDLRFNDLAIIEMGATILSFMTLLVLIFTISPIHAYVISQVVLYALKGILYFFCYQKTWRPSFVFDLSECREVLPFGAFQLASRLVNRIGSNIDVILIGRFLGAEALGIYNLVYQIVTIPVLKINPVLTRVAFPVFSKHQGNAAALNDGFLHMTKLLGLVTFPMLMGLTAVANVFIQSVFGVKWMEAVPILQIMAIVGILRVLMNPNGSVILAKGKANLAFYWDAGVLVLYGMSLWGAVQTGSLEAVAWTYSAVSLVNFVVGRWLLAWLIQLQWKEYFKTIAAPFGLSLIMTVTAYFIKETSVQYFPHAAIWPLLISVSAGAGLYIVLLGVAYPNFIKKRTRGQQL